MVASIILQAAKASTLIHHGATALVNIYSCTSAHCLARMQIPCLLCPSVMFACTPDISKRFEQQQDGDQAIQDVPCQVRTGDLVRVRHT